MKCPNCSDQSLVMSERQSVEIDYCPACRGVWLDRGELDKLLERAAGATPSVLSSAPRAHADDHRHRGHHQRHAKSWLSEIFD